MGKKLTKLRKDEHKDIDGKIRRKDKIRIVVPDLSSILGIKKTKKTKR